MKVVNKWLEGYLRNYVSGKQSAWMKWLHLGDFCYNYSYHMSIKMFPFMDLYGYEAPSFVDILFDYSRVPKAHDFL